MQDFKIDEKIINGTSINNDTVEGLPYLRKSLFRNSNNEKTEFAIGVEWIKTVNKINAYWKTGIGLFAKPHIQCNLKEQVVTIRFLENCFDIKFD